MFVHISPFIENVLEKTTVSMPGERATFRISNNQEFRGPPRTTMIN